ncbi:MAG: cytochrome c [Acidimicrobiia bacterium]|nr:cytochrome c [Acidimicrobiia bacterium]
MRPARNRTSRRRVSERPRAPEAKGSRHCASQSDRHRGSACTCYLVCRDRGAADPGPPAPCPQGERLFVVGRDLARRDLARRVDWRDCELAVARTYRARARRVVSDLISRPRRNLIAVVGSIGIAIAACSAAGETIDSTPTALASPEQPATGAELYAASCAECHGADLRGTDRGPSHLSIVYEPDHHSDATFLLAVRNGVRSHHWDYGPMLPIDGLSDEDVTAIVAYVRSVQSEQGFEPYP